MKPGVRNTVIGCVAFMVILVGLSVNRILTPPAMDRDSLNEQGLFVYDVPRRFSNFDLTFHTGETFSREDLEGKWTLIFFGFTYCPDICPLTMATLSRFSSLLEDTPYGEDTQVIMVSVDPDRDTPEKLAEYVGFFNDDYLAATSEYINIFTLARQLNIAFSYLPGEVEGEYEVSHSGEIPLINPYGDFHGFFKYPPVAEEMLETYTVVRENFE